jgi:hypothetical protein
MRHLQILVDGRTAFEADVPDMALPSDDDLVALLPEMLRPKTGQRPASITRVTLLTMLIETIRQGLEGSSLFQPIEVAITTRGMGRASIDIDMAVEDA